MRQLNKIVDDYINKLKESESLNGIDIIRAFPNTRKSTILNRPYITLGLTDIDLNRASVGEHEKCGTFGVFCNIHIPFKMEAALAEIIFSNICEAVLDFQLIKVKASPISYLKETDCYLLQTVFTFYDEIQLGGEGHA